MIDRLLFKNARFFVRPTSITSEQVESWVVQAQAGDLEAFESLVDLYDKRIYNAAFRLLRNPQDAEDVLQETFLKAFENLASFRRQSSFYTWIVQIAVNAALQKLTKQRKGLTVSLDSANGEDEGYRPQEIAVWEDPEKIYSQKEIQNILDRTIASLPAIYRSVFVLKDLENLPMEQVASMLGISLAAAKSRLIRARLELRERLGGHFRKKGAPIYSADHSHDHS